MLAGAMRSVQGRSQLDFAGYDVSSAEREAIVAFFLDLADQVESGAVSTGAELSPEDLAEIDRLAEARRRG
ncbi:MAG: hypothetical protein LBK95_11500 [Bifidobacteriaceae bacterium]|jgi:hypothetical protein|nr:hypothetical protein [Bifidobacteriaceae bacterium]